MTTQFSKAGEPRTPAGALWQALGDDFHDAYRDDIVAGVLASLAENGYAIIDVSPDGPGHHTTAELDEASSLSGRDLTEGAGPDASCGCGEPITFYDGVWLHIINPELRGTDDHDAEPDDPDSVDWSDYEDEEEEDG